MPIRRKRSAGGSRCAPPRRSVGRLPVATACAIGIAARSGYLEKQAAAALETAGIRTVSLAKKSRKEAVRVGTIHRMKGLEFQAVAVIGVADGFDHPERTVVPRRCFVGPSSYDPIISSINPREIVMTTRHGAGLDSLGGPANSHQQVLTDVGLDDDDCYYVDWQGAWWPCPAWMHPECVDTRFAVENGTCCKYPADDLVLRALDLANAVDGTLTAFDVHTSGDCQQAAGELARLLKSVPTLIAEIRPAMTDDNGEVVAQLLCPVGRLNLLVLELSLRSGCPWACSDHGASDRRAELAPMVPVLDECQDALFAVLAPKPRQRRGA